jgi:predicted nucleotidyltransferase
MSTDPIALLRDRLAADPAVVQAIVFGSLAQGTARPDSDLDIAIDLGAPMSPRQRLARIEALGTLLGRPIDLVDLRDVGEPLLGQVLAGGVRLKGRDEDYARLLTRHLIDQADFMPLRKRILDARRQAWIGR